MNPWKVPMCQAYKLERRSDTALRYKLVFDGAVRWVGMRESMWGVWRASRELVFGGVERVFVLVEKEKGLSDVEWEEEKRRRNEEYSERFEWADGNGMVLAWKDKDRKWDGVRVVDSMEEVFRDINGNV